jgi:hypothetical protein
VAGAFDSNVCSAGELRTFKLCNHRAETINP